MNTTRLARIFVVLLATGFFVTGYAQLQMPHMHRFGEPLHSPYPAYALCLTGMVLSCVYQRAATELVWLISAMHRWMSLGMLALYLFAESLMHALGIPHMEGWGAMLLLSSGALITGISAWWWRIRKK